MLVSRISPAPRSTPSRDPRDGVAPGRRAPAGHVGLPARRPRRRAAWRRPRARRTARRTRSASSPISSGRASAAELTQTLSAPASSTAWASATDADPAADRERDEDVVGGAARELDDRRRACSCVAVMSRKTSSSAPSRVVALGQLDRVARVAQVDEVRALDDAAAVDVQARDTRLSARHRTASARRVTPVSERPERALALGDVKRPLVERLADDHAAEVDLAQRRERAQVLERADRRPSR